MKPYAIAKRYNLWDPWNNQNALLLKSDLIVYDSATNHNNWNPIKSGKLIAEVKFCTKVSKEEMHLASQTTYVWVNTQT